MLIAISLVLIFLMNDCSYVKNRYEFNVFCRSEGWVFLHCDLGMQHWWYAFCSGWRTQWYTPCHWCRQRENTQGFYFLNLDFFLGSSCRTKAALKIGCTLRLPRDEPKLAFVICHTLSRVYTYPSASHIGTIHIQLRDIYIYIYLVLILVESHKILFYGYTYSWVYNCVILKYSIINNSCFSLWHACVVQSFVGHGDSINEIRTQPLKPSLVVSASKVWIIKFSFFYLFVL